MHMIRRTAMYQIGPLHSLRYEGCLPTSYTLHSSLNMIAVQKARFVFSAVFPVVKAHKGLTPNPTHGR